MTNFPRDTVSAQTEASRAEPGEYNYEHFRPRLLMVDVRQWARPEGPLPGQAAPDFGLEDLAGRRWRLSALRGRPAVLIFGSGT